MDTQWTPSPTPLIIGGCKLNGNVFFCKKLACSRISNIKNAILCDFFLNALKILALLLILSCRLSGVFWMESINNTENLRTTVYKSVLSVLYLIGKVNPYCYKQEQLLIIIIWFLKIFYLIAPLSGDSWLFIRVFVSFVLIPVFPNWSARILYITAWFGTRQADRSHLLAVIMMIKVPWHIFPLVVVI